MSPAAVDSLSPLDGRYAGKLGAVSRIFSEAGLMRERVRVECAWLSRAGGGPCGGADGVPAGSGSRLAQRDVRRSGSHRCGLPSNRSKRAPTTTSRRSNIGFAAELESRGATSAQLEWVHFGCTSEDINNLAYALMLKHARSAVLLPALESHGRAARPT